MKTAVAVLAVVALCALASAERVEDVTRASKYKPHYKPYYPKPTPKPHPKKCSYYADMYEKVFIGKTGKKCYPLVIDGKYTVVGYVCVTIVVKDYKKCIAYEFVAKEGYYFGGIYVGASAFPYVKSEYLYKGYGKYYKKTVYVCLDEFYAGPKGCCNAKIYLYIKVVVYKYECIKHIIPTKKPYHPYKPYKPHYKPTPKPKCDKKCWYLKCKAKYGKKYCAKYLLKFIKKYSRANKHKCKWVLKKYYAYPKDDCYVKYGYSYCPVYLYCIGKKH